MNRSNTLSILLLSFFLICFHQVTNACSMYKVTSGDKTMVGCNEDAWRTNSMIWFVNARSENEYGAGFTGSRQVSPNGFAPQSGMNEAGLVFSRLASYHPRQELPSDDRKRITNEVTYLTDILLQCATVEEVKRYIEQYDHSFFLGDVFMYIDRSGNYLVVEPYNLILGNDPYYVLSNFCPSITDSENAKKLVRYRNGLDYLDSHTIDASLSFCTAVSDTMHVCRERNGDGTLLTSIWDTKDGLVNLFFYHDFDNTVQFALSEELAKGDHIIDIPSLFPVNAEFERLISYKTPFNVPPLRFSLVFVGGVLFLFSLLYLVSYFRRRNVDKFNLSKLLFLGLNGLLIVYLAILATNINIYYFDAPYQHYGSKLVSLSSYIPFLLLLLIIPLVYYSIRYIKGNSKRLWVKSALVLNNVIYAILLYGFGYWGLFQSLSSGLSKFFNA